jgi:hypothetical protein
VTADTAEFAVQSIRTWRERMGLARYPNMSELVPDLIRDHGRLRRLERRARAAMESRVAEAR